MLTAMSNFDNILLAIEQVQEAPLLLPKASRLGARKLHAVRVIYEGLADLPSRHIDHAAELKSYVLQAETGALEEAITAHSSGMDIETATVWHRSIWQGVLHTAESIDASLIAKQVHRPHASGYLGTPDDWNLIRHSRVPVLLSQLQDWSAQPAVYAALDVYDDAHAAMNRRVLESAWDLTRRLGGQLHIVSVFPVLSNWMDQITTVMSYQHLKREIEQEISTAVARLTGAMGLRDYRLHVLEGLADVEITRTVDAGSVLVIGCKARTGVSGYLIGNTAEKVLHRAEVDILAIP